MYSPVFFSKTTENTRNSSSIFRQLPRYRVSDIRKLLASSYSAVLSKFSSRKRRVSASRIRTNVSKDSDPAVLLTLIRVELILGAFDVTGLPGRDLILETCNRTRSIESRRRNKREIFGNLEQIDRQTIETSHSSS